MNIFHSILYENLHLYNISRCFGWHLRIMCCFYHQTDNLKAIKSLAVEIKQLLGEEGCFPSTCSSRGIGCTDATAYIAEILIAVAVFRAVLGIVTVCRLVAICTLCKSSVWYHYGPITPWYHHAVFPDR